MRKHKVGDLAHVENLGKYGRGTIIELKGKTAVVKLDRPSPFKFGKKFITKVKANAK
ncbi:MAG: hypothetical protein H7Y13_02400 [Sphingobacteriaceae bacterium]|nr:hypothetical protein [Sphingobacteriaceae bacterium]